MNEGTNQPNRNYQCSLLSRLCVTMHRLQANQAREKEREFIIVVAIMSVNLTSVVSVVSKRD